MLNWFRSRASGVAATLLLSLAALGASATSPHEDDCHDASCAVFVEHDATAHRMAAPSATASADPFHCLVCHWTRSFRPPITTALVATPAAQAGTHVRLDPITVARNAQIAQPSPRSPPRLLLEA